MFTMENKLRDNIIIYTEPIHLGTSYADIH